jgi:hypothetical protein
MKNETAKDSYNFEDYDWENVEDLGLPESVYLFSEYIKFPASTQHNIEAINKLINIVGSIEQVEKDFRIEFFRKDGEVCFEAPPRFIPGRRKLKVNEDYLFEVTLWLYDGDLEQSMVRITINEKERCLRGPYIR